MMSCVGCHTTDSTMKAACHRSMQRCSPQTRFSASLSQLWGFHSYLLQMTAALKKWKVKVFTDSSEGYTLVFSHTGVIRRTMNFSALDKETLKLKLPPFILTLALPAWSVS